MSVAVTGLSEEDKKFIVQEIVAGRTMFMGGGGFGKVFYIKFNMVRYVIKQSLLNSKTRDIYNNEVHILNLVSNSSASKYVPKYKGRYISPHEGRVYGYIFMEFIYGDTLSHVIEDIHSGTLRPTDEEINIILNGLPQALAALHARHILHLDIKPDNIWVTMENNYTKKITGVSFIDFGLSILSTPAMQSMGFAGGTPGFMSPKIKEAFNLGTLKVRYNRTNNQYALDKSLDLFKTSLLKRKAPAAAPVPAPAPTPATLLPPLNINLLKRLPSNKRREVFQQVPALRGLSTKEAMELLSRL